MTALQEYYSLNPLAIRKVLGRAAWGPPSPFGPAGWHFEGVGGRSRIIVSSSPGLDPDDPAVEWVHASISRRDRMPSYEDLTTLHRAVFGGGWAYQVFAPPSDHVNIHEYCLHLWGRADGAAVLLNFGIGGSI